MKDPVVVAMRHTQHWSLTIRSARHASAWDGSVLPCTATYAELVQQSCDATSPSCNVQESWQDRQSCGGVHTTVPRRSGATLTCTNSAHASEMLRQISQLINLH